MGRYSVPAKGSKGGGIPVKGSKGGVRGVPVRAVKFFLVFIKKCVKIKKLNSRKKYKIKIF
jgi:hypothetical protein